VAEHSELWSLTDFISATGGRLTGKPAQGISGMSIDSRTIAPGEAFFAISGEARDGHTFAADALDKGAALAVVAEDKAADIGATPLLAVANPLEALENLGRAARARSPAQIIAVTGSVGKTGTKEMLRAALSPSGETHASAASYNNQWGVPLSLALLPRTARFAIFEVGMNHPGEILPLARMIRPHIAIITSVAPVHLEYFASLDDVAAAKAEIFAGLEPGGAAILNRDNAYFDFLAERARAAGAGRVIGFGEDERADARAAKLSLHADCSAVSADILGIRATYKVGAPGKHQVINSLAVLAAVQLAGGDLARGALALGAWRAPRGRGRRLVFTTQLGAVSIIDESYNANPASMRAAIATLSQAQPSGNGRRIAVLGDMLELGEAAPRLHAELAEPLLDAHVDLVYTAGPMMAALRDALPAALRAGHAKESDGLADILTRDIRPGDVVMIKGSLGSRMAPLVAALERHLVLRYEATAATAN
jgi:UDP-N-acetylmuramoyl-tripeptide--D-alanyl-D-alanine ligase